MGKIITKQISANLLSFDELAPGVIALFYHAFDARLNAQAPYSNYLVGCAVRDIHGNVAAGCNVENCNWSETIHAEGNAISSLISQHGPTPLDTVVTVGGSENLDIVFPPTRTELSPIVEISNLCPACGKCLQTIAENCFDSTGSYNPDVTLYGYLEDSGAFYRTTIGDAFPMPFPPQYLGIDYSKYRK
jgi:cytidine deaminase